LQSGETFEQSANQAKRGFWEEKCRDLYRRQMETPTPCCGCQQVYLYKDLRPTITSEWAEATDPSFSREFGRQLGLEEKMIRPHSYCPTC
jgi:hypothetical protein